MGKETKNNDFVFRINEIVSELLDEKNFTCSWPKYSNVVTVAVFEFGKWENIGGRNNGCKNNFIVLTEDKDVLKRTGKSKEDMA